MAWQDQDLAAEDLWIRSEKLHEKPAESVPLKMILMELLTGRASWLRCVHQQCLLKAGFLFDLGSQVY